MKRLLLGLGTIFFTISLIATAQTQGGPGPRAWCDKDNDGKCDFTGQPVGQGRSRGMAGMRQGQGCGRHGCGQQSGCCRRVNCPAAQSTSTPAPAPVPESKK